MAFFEQGASSHTILPLAEFAVALRGHGPAGHAKAQTPGRSGCDVRRQREFGFRWFVPELLKHRKVSGATCCWPRSRSSSWRSRRRCSPRSSSTRSIVHHTLNTLVVIGIALAVFMVFTAAMTWVRQYLVLHTGNRIDAVLGSAGVRASVQAAAALLRAPADRHAGRAHPRRRDHPRVHQRRGRHADARRAVPADLPRDHVLLQRAR